MDEMNVNEVSTETEVEEFDMCVSYNKHYITVDESGLITDGWSNGPHYNRDTTDAICINEQGSYQFRLFPDGVENPVLITPTGIPLYKYEDGVVIERSEEEIKQDEENIPKPVPTVSEMDQLRADVDFLAAMQGVDL